MAEGSTGTSDARHDGADGDVEDDGEVFVLDLLDVAEQESLAELWLKLLERGVEGSLVIKANEGVFGGGAGGSGVECVGMVFEEDSAGDSDAGARGEEGVAEDAKIQALKLVLGWNESKARKDLVKVS